MHTLTLTPDIPFDLETTLSCGQVFRWVREDGWWSGAVRDKVIRIRQEGSRLTWEGADKAFIRNYFSLDLDLVQVLQAIDRDRVIHEAIGSCRGLRIIRQPPWECLASYIIATFTNIPSIKRRISLICEEFGDEIRTGNSTWYSFPPPDRLAGEEDCLLKTCRLGYRAPFLCETAGALSGNPGWVDSVDALSYEEARKALMKYKGVGKKVADCVLLFGFGRLESVPVDVWIERILKKYYGEDLGGKPDYETMRKFARNYFGPYAGYAQEYLFTVRKDL